MNKRIVTVLRGKTSGRLAIPQGDQGTEKINLSQIILLSGRTLADLCGKSMRWYSGHETGQCYNIITKSHCLGLKQNGWWGGSLRQGRERFAAACFMHVRV